MLNEIVRKLTPYLMAGAVVLGGGGCKSLTSTCPPVDLSTPENAVRSALDQLPRYLKKECSKKEVMELFFFQMSQDDDPKYHEEFFSNHLDSLRKKFSDIIHSKYDKITSKSVLQHAPFFEHTKIKITYSSTFITKSGQEIKTKKCDYTYSVRNINNLWKIYYDVDVDCD